MTDYAKVSEVKPGTVLIADGGFTCIKEGTELTVARDEGIHELYVPCSYDKGRHYIEGQIEDRAGHAVYIGLRLKPAA